MLGPNEKRLSLMVASVCSWEQAGQGWEFVRKGLPGFLLGQPMKTLEPGRPKDFRTRNSPVFGKVVDSIGSVMKLMRFSSHTHSYGDSVTVFTEIPCGPAMNPLKLTPMLTCLKKAGSQGKAQESSRVAGLTYCQQPGQDIL